MGRFTFVKDKQTLEEDAIVVPEKSAADNFEAQATVCLTSFQNKQFFGQDKEEDHSCPHLIFQTDHFYDEVPEVRVVVKLRLFPFSRGGQHRIWLEKEPPRSSQTWDDLVSKFINKFFPPSKTTNLRNEITRFQQRFDEDVLGSMDRFNGLLFEPCPHMDFRIASTRKFYNALTSNDQIRKFTRGGNFLDKMLVDCLRIIEAIQIAELKDMVKALLLDKKNQSPAPTPVKAVEKREPRSQRTDASSTNNGSTKDVPPPVVPVVHHESISEPVNAPVSASRPNQKASIPFPSRRNDEKTIVTS
ncbi:reverse transcriptase domain-containing protein [Tanacetum coccineum]